MNRSPRKFLDSQAQVYHVTRPSQVPQPFDSQREFVPEANAPIIHIL